MNSITQDINFKQSVIKYSYKHGVTATSIVYKLHRKTIYRWREKYDGTLKSLANKSRRPHRSPNAHTEAEIKMIKDYKNKNKDTGLVVLWVKLRKAGYTRSVTSLYRMMIKLGIYKKTPSKKRVYEPKEYQQMQYPGQRVQVDAKYVPMKCLTKELKEQGERYFQYTAIDEYTRMRVLWFAKEHSTYESSQFIDEIIKKFPFKIEEIQTDNGFEFTNRLSYNTSIRDRKTLFESKLKKLGIRHKLIKPYTPRHNGKVERSHRNDNERFYSYLKFYSLEDLRKQGAAYLKRSNRIPMAVLGYLTPKEKRSELEVFGMINYAI